VVTAVVVCADANVLDTNNDKRGIIANAIVLIGIIISCYNTNFNPWIYTYKYNSIKRYTIDYSTYTDIYLKVCNDVFLFLFQMYCRAWIFTIILLDVLNDIQQQSFNCFIKL
jgi:hypothetical protein